MTRHIMSQNNKPQNHDYAPLDCCARKSLLRSSHRTTHKTETPSPDANLNRRDLGRHGDLNGAFGGVRLIFVMCNSMRKVAWILPAPSPVGCQVKKANRAARTASEHSNAAAVQQVQVRRLELGMRSFAFFCTATRQQTSRVLCRCYLHCRPAAVVHIMSNTARNAAVEAAELSRTVAEACRNSELASPEPVWSKYKLAVRHRID